MNDVRINRQVLVIVIIAAIAGYLAVWIPWSLAGSHKKTASGAEPSATPDSSRQRIEEFRVMAERGDAAAQYNLGVCYHNGDGVEEDAKEAVKWFRKAAAQGLNST
jgi:TPR repeat protein